MLSRPRNETAENTPNPQGIIDRRISATEKLERSGIRQWLGIRLCAVIGFFQKILEQQRAEKAAIGSRIAKKLLSGERISQEDGIHLRRQYLSENEAFSEAFNREIVVDVREELDIGKIQEGAQVNVVDLPIKCLDDGKEVSLLGVKEGISLKRVPQKNGGGKPGRASLRFEPGKSFRLSRIIGSQDEELFGIDEGDYWYAMTKDEWIRSYYEGKVIFE